MIRCFAAPLAGWLIAACVQPAFGQRGAERGARDASLEPCDIHFDQGRDVQSRRCYLELVGHPDPGVRAEAHWMLGDLKAANDAFREAVRRQPEHPDLRVRWGHLYIESHQQSDAAQLFQEALEIDEDHVPAKLGMARVLASRFEGKASDFVDQALEKRPAQAEGYLLKARMALEEGAYGKAREALETALERIEDLGLAPLEAYSLLASLEMLERDRDPALCGDAGNAALAAGMRDNQWVAKALAYNPRYGQVYADQAHFYVITRRYREATERLRKAVQANPRLWRAHAELGINLLREGLDEEGRRHLVMAYNGDPYNARTVNSLRLLDSQPEDFQVIESEQLLESGQPRVKAWLANSEVDLLAPYVLELSLRAMDTFARKYEYELDRTVRVQLYPNHDDFAVRTMGMPGVGLLGVTFGDVVVMDSPSGRGAGDFHWGTTLWHELAHVYTLEATRHRVPRWYSEGISMYEEWMVDSRWGEPPTPEFIEAVRDGKLLPVADLDRGFIRPTDPSQIAVSYLQAGYACRFIAKRWGERKLVELLKGFAACAGTGPNISAVLGIEPEEFDTQFNRYVRGALGAALDGLPRWRRNLQAALRAARDKDWEAVFEPAQAAKAAYPQHVGEGSAYVLLSTAHQQTGNLAAAVEELVAYERLGGRRPDTLMKLGRWLEEGGRPDEAVRTYQELIYNWPKQDRLHQHLGRLHLASGDLESAVREFFAAMALDPIDRVLVEYDLARAYAKMGDRSNARLHALHALERAPTFGPALHLLQELMR